MSIEKYVQKEIELVARLRAATESIAQAEADAGAAYVDAEDGQSTSASLDAVLRAKAEVPLIESAIRTVRGRRLDAARSKRAEASAELRKQASAVRAQIASIETKVAKHIGAINELQSTHVTVSVTAPGEPPAKSQLLETQAMAIEQRAAALDGELPRHGTVTLDDVTDTDPMIAAVLMHASDGPSARDLASWAAAVEQRAIAAGRGQFGQNPRRYYLVWKNSVIDTTESYIQVHGLARRPAGPISGEPVFEIGSDLFYARSTEAVG
jgi:hypothetical protein